jgi:uncharacterized protein DUF6575
MLGLDGVVFQSLPISGLERVRDIEYFDGPLLTHFKHHRGDHFLYYWCDRDSQFHRWMLLRVSETNIIRLVNRFVPLDYVVPNGCLDDFVYFVDVDAQCRHSNVTLLQTEKIPAEYVPEKGAYLDSEIARDERS